MRAQLSVVIPTLNAESELPALAAGLMEGVQTGLIRELVVSDGGSTDGTLLIAVDLGARVVQGAPSRGGQLRRGANAASGAWLLFLHADSALPDGWTQVVSAQMAQGGPAYFKLAFNATGLAPRLVAGWANVRARVFALPYGDQGLLISRKTYDAAGGFPDIPLMEDVALARALARTPGARPVDLPLAIRTSAARYQRDGWLRRGARNLWLLIRYLAGADPTALARAYRAPRT
ncbi:TIGR04283 family arsenosugar biosynthesis glycosyltransferase [Rhodobacteraceae bacterium KMM 6894]|nr:TIGR04283 family arsenosugar biosynthesis glycosyltransferase [Rhodobacteraceae bacterium KMM 6894]